MKKLFSIMSHFQTNVWKSCVGTDQQHHYSEITVCPTVFKANIKNI